MSLDPLYRSESLRPAFQLRYTWTGWLKSAWRHMPDACILETIDPLWEQDGMRRLEHGVRMVRGMASMAVVRACRAPAGTA